jgi:hypothetical protein
MSARPLTIHLLSNQRCALSMCGALYPGHRWDAAQVTTDPSRATCRQCRRCVLVRGAPIPRRLRIPHPTPRGWRRRRALRLHAQGWNAAAIAVVLECTKANVLAYLREARPQPEVAPEPEVHIPPPTGRRRRIDQGWGWGAASPPLPASMGEILGHGPSYLYAHCRACQVELRPSNHLGLCPTCHTAQAIGDQQPDEPHNPLAGRSTLPRLAWHTNARGETVGFDGHIKPHLPAYVSRNDYFGDTPEADDNWAA